MSINFHTSIIAASRRAVAPPAGGITAFAYVAAYEEPANETTYTFAAADFGAAASDRRILIGFFCRAGGARTIVSATIGGVSATILHQQPSNNNDTVGWLIAAVPTGATGTVEVVLSGGAVRAGIHVYRILGEPTTDYADGGFSSTSVSRSVSSSGGYIAAICGGRGNSTLEWTGVTSDAKTLVEFADDFETASAAVAGVTTVSVTIDGSFSRGVSIVSLS